MLNAKPRADSGFSLVETVAAMGILALAAIPLMQVTTDATINTASLESRLLARTVAENVMVRATTDRGPLDAGISNGTQTQLNQSFTWSLTIGPADANGLQALEVTVRPEEGTQVLARLSSLSYSPVPLPELEEPSQPTNRDDGS